jgi:hypothetical protein
MNSTLALGCRSGPAAYVDPELNLFAQSGTKDLSTGGIVIKAAQYLAVFYPKNSGIQQSHVALSSNEIGTYGCIGHAYVTTFL